MENYYSLKNENKVLLFEKTINLFIQEGIPIDEYFESYVTCCTDKILNTNENLREITMRMYIKY